MYYSSSSFLWFNPCNFPFAAVLGRKVPLSMLLLALRKCSSRTRKLERYPVDEVNYYHERI